MSTEQKAGEATRFDGARGVRASREIVLVGGCRTAFGAFGGSLKDEFEIPGSDSQRAIDLIESEFASEQGAVMNLVFAAVYLRTSGTGLRRAATVPAIEQEPDVVTIATTPAGPIGVLVVQDYENSDTYTERDVELLTSVADQIAVAPAHLRHPAPLVEVCRSGAGIRAVRVRDQVDDWQQDQLLGVVPEQLAGAGVDGDSGADAAAVEGVDVLRGELMDVLELRGGVLCSRP